MTGYVSAQPIGNAPTRSARRHWLLVTLASALTCLSIYLALWSIARVVPITPDSRSLAERERTANDGLRGSGAIVVRAKLLI